MATTASSLAEGNGIFTTAEIKRLNIDYTGWELPEPKQCEYCGNTIYHEVCVFMGRVMSVRSVPQTCSCEKAQAMAKKQEERQRREKQKRDKEEKIQKLLKHSGLPVTPRYQNCNFDNYKPYTQEQKTALSIAKSYAKNFDKYINSGTGLYIEGTNGTGKTHFAVAIARYIIETFGYKVKCNTLIEICNDIRRTYDNSDMAEDDIIQSYCKIPLLIIDDLGKEKPTEWNQQILYSIINNRYNLMKPTIITTNFNEDMLNIRLTPYDSDNTNAAAIISRLRETTQLITMAWDDYRGSYYGKT